MEVQKSKSRKRTNIQEIYDSMKRERASGSIPVAQTGSQVRIPPSRRLLGPKSLNPITSSIDSAPEVTESKNQQHILKRPIQLPNLRFKTINHDEDLNDRIERLSARQP